MSDLAMTCPLTRGQRILVPVDGSDFSDQAVNQAVSLGQVCSSQIYVVSVAELQAEYLADAPKLYERLQSEAGQTSQKAKKKIEDAGLSCEALTLTNESAADAILGVAKDKEVDLIVMGTRGRSRLKRLILGSVAQQVVGQAPCPVMIVPAG